MYLYARVYLTWVLKCMGVLGMRDFVLVCRVVLCTGECWGMRIAVR